jgi:hypothetical protein
MITVVNTTVSVTISFLRVRKGVEVEVERVISAKETAEERRVCLSE